MAYPDLVSRVVPDSAIARAMPKSTSIARSPVRTMFSGFTSRCTMPSR